jgi:hypothetical protein
MAQKSIDLLCDLGVLEEITGQSWGRVYIAKAILKAIETPPSEEGLCNLHVDDLERNPKQRFGGTSPEPSSG